MVTSGARTLDAAGAPKDLKMRVLDSIREDGAKLVELSAESVPVLRAYQPGIRLVPIVYFHPARAPRPLAASRPKTTGARASASIDVRIVSRQDRSPVAGAFVVAFTDFANRVGAQGTTNQRGVVRLRLGAARKRIERLYVYPERGYWGTLRRSLTLSSDSRFELKPVDLRFRDALRQFYGRDAHGSGAGVVVGIIDTGVDTTHPDLKVQGGENTVPGEDPGDFGDNGGEGHGTHVAGIVAAHGSPPAGIRGMAPDVTLRSYRVYGERSDSASNFAIAKAIDRAAEDGCDLINMSLGGGDPDDATKAALEDARAQGTVAIVASGNDDRSPVSFPASDSLAIAVSALGRKGTFPSGALEAGDVKGPYGRNRLNFVAAFSNIGPEIDLIGPGVGILSTVPGGYAPMSGTSMACPAVTGAAARLLSTLPDILGMPRDEARSEAMAQALLQSGRSLGFEATYEGHGLPR